MKIDLNFPLSFSPGTIIPKDHGYLLFSALSKKIPEIHSNNKIFIHLIRGDCKNHAIYLTKNSYLTIRCNINEAYLFKPLLEASLTIGCSKVFINGPKYQRLLPSSVLFVPSVMIKFAKNPGNKLSESFLNSISKKLPDGIKIEIGKKRVSVVKDARLFGYDVFLSDILPEDSVLIQERGIGGRLSMGCGIPRVPLRIARGVVIPKPQGALANNIMSENHL